MLVTPGPVTGFTNKAEPTRNWSSTSYVLCCSGNSDHNGLRLLSCERHVGPYRMTAAPVKDDKRNNVYK